ncbi:MAG: outer membrane beta-barrel protein [Enterovibrio sp.]
MKLTVVGSAMYLIRNCIHAILLATVLTPSAAMAGAYAGILVGYQRVEYEPNDLSLFSKGAIPSVALQAGYFFNDYLAVEGRYGASVKRDNSLNLDKMGALFIKGNLPVTSRAALYGLLGYSTFSLDKQAANTVSESGMSVGAGLHFALNQNSAVVFDFVNHVNGKSATANSFTVGFQYLF